MKKFYYIILVIIIATMAFFIVKKNMKVTYKTITEKGVTIDIPKGYESTTYDEWRVFSDDNFHIGVASMEVSEEATIDEYMPYFKDLLLYGYIEESGYRFNLPMADNMDNIILTDYSVERINGEDIGSVVISFDQKGKNKTHRVSAKFYYLITDDHQVILIITISQRNEESKYQAIVDHVVNSIKMQ